MKAAVSCAAGENKNNNSFKTRIAKRMGNG